MAPPKYSIKDFELVKELGRGGFATVYYAKCLKPVYYAKCLKLGCPKEVEEVAIKKIEKAFIKRQKIEDRVIKEKEIHIFVNHANIVKCYATFEDEYFIYLMLELCQVTLEKYLKKQTKLTAVVFPIIHQIVVGLQYLHDNGIMHRDLSLRNILVNPPENGKEIEIKITDFGLSTPLKTPNDQLYSIVGTRRFQSPEMHNYKTYDLTSDCWSLGIVILAVLGGEVPSDIKDIEIPNTFSPEEQELVTGLLQENPDDRWSLKNVMESSFFNMYGFLCDEGNPESYPMKGNSRTKKGLSRDSGMESNGISLAATGKSSHQSQRQLDSGFNCINTSTTSHNNGKISLLSPSAEHSYPSKHGKTRHKHDINKPLIPLERDNKKISTIPNTRERSASEEQRKQERQQIQCEMKTSYSGEARHTSHHSRDRLKMSQMKSSQRNSYHSSNRDKCFSPSRSTIETENVRSKFRQSNSNIENVSCPKTNQQFGKVLQETSTKKQKPLPLNTERLNACRYPMKKIAVVSILGNGEVCVEWLKTIRGKQYVSHVFFISSDGKGIDTYKPRNCLVGSTPPPKPTDNKHINSFPYDDLPSKYWKMYRKAKALVDWVRSTTGRITYYDEDSNKCIMMENYPNPDFKMEFFNGGNITQKSNKISITDEWGQTISVAELDRSDKHFAVMWNKFCKMKEWCKIMEAQLDATKIGPIPYPVFFGNPPPPEKKCNSTKENFKENIALPSSEVPATSKYTHNSYEKTINSSNKYRLNSPSTYSSSPDYIDAIFMKLKGSPRLIEGAVYIEYKDGYTVRCSKDCELVWIYDSRKNCVYHSQYNDKTDSLIDMILQDLPFFVPVAVFHAMKPAVT